MVIKSIIELVISKVFEAHVFILNSSVLDCLENGMKIHVSHKYPKLAV